MTSDENAEVEEALLQRSEDTSSEKEKIAQQSLRDSAAAQEDVSRSTLHYGSSHKAEINEISKDVEVAPTDGSAPFVEYTEEISSSELLQPNLDSVLKEKATSSEHDATTIESPKEDARADEPTQFEPVQSSRAVAPEKSSSDPIDAEVSAPSTRSDEEPEAVATPSTEPKATPLGENDETARRPVEADFEDQTADALNSPSTVPPTELWIDNSGIPSDLEGAVVGQIEMDGSDHEGYSFAVSDDRFEVVGKQLKLKDDVSFADGDFGLLSLEVTAVGPAGLELTQSLDFEVIDTPDVSASTGFRASYFDVDQRLSDLEDIDWSADPTHEEVVSDINYQNSRGSFWEGGDTDTFGARINGNVDVEEGGSFKFFLGGDDGVVLLVNGEEVIDNDGLHSYKTRTGEIELEPGTHHIEVRYFENYGHAGLKLEWEGPGVDGRELVTAPTLDNAQTINGMPVTFQLDIAGSGADLETSTFHHLEGLPEGTVVLAGEMSAIADSTGTVDLAGWDISTLSVTPPVEFVGNVQAQMVTTSEGSTGAKVSTSTDLSFTVNQAELPPPSVEMVTGFRASYFDVDQRLSDLDDIDWSADPTHEEVVSDINYQNSRGSFWEGGDTDTFGARITGNVDVEEGGSFKFFLGGDDGVVLLVNGEEVIDNDGLHSYKTRTGEIKLEPGTHHIEVRYFENYGHAGLKLEWEGPGVDGRELVTSDSDLAVEENGMIAVRIEDTDLSVNTQVEISGMPADTILISGDNVAVSTGTEMDLTGWDLEVLEIAPPPGFEGEITGEITSTNTAFNGEAVTGQASFTIEVGDVTENMYAQNGASEPGILDIYAGADADNSWVDVADSQEADDTSNENAMEEPVVEQADSTQYNDMNDAYERSDW